MKNPRLIDFEKLKFEIRNTMRYDDVGDYFDETIIAFDMKDDIVNNAIFLHEFIEYCLVRSAGIPVEMIDKFDTDSDHRDKFREEYKLYKKFHSLANIIEKQFVENLGINWKEHDRRIYSTKVAVTVQEAIQDATDELHEKNPSEETIGKSVQIVKEALE